MKVSELMTPVAPSARRPKTPRDRTTYRAAQRNIAKIEYRREKKRKKTA